MNLDLIWNRSVESKTKKKRKINYGSILNYYVPAKFDMIDT